MVKLKPCPFCGDSDYLSSGDRGPRRYRRCTWCGAEVTRETQADADAAWNRRTEPANEPLTLDELRGMDGEPVWCVDGAGHECWCLIDVDDDRRANAIDKDTGLWDGDFYGMTCSCKILQRDCKCPNGLHPMGWLAYRRKPQTAQEGAAKHVD